MRPVKSTKHLYTIRFQLKVLKWLVPLKCSSRIYSPPIKIENDTSDISRKYIWFGITISKIISFNKWFKPFISCCIIFFRLYGCHDCKEHQNCASHNNNKQLFRNVKFTFIKIISRYFVWYWNLDFTFNLAHIASKYHHLDVRNLHNRFFFKQYMQYIDLYLNLRHFANVTQPCMN